MTKVTEISSADTGKTGEPSQLRTVRITPKEWFTMREGIAGAHLMIQAFGALISRHRHEHEKGQRELLQIAPQSMANAFVTSTIVTNREARQGHEEDEQPTQVLTDLDIPTFRDELENISALALLDLEHEMTCAINELPGIASAYYGTETGLKTTAHLMAVCWEAGRRYGVMQSLAVHNALLQDVQNSSAASFDSILNSTLELPAQMDLPITPTADAGDARSGDEGSNQDGTTGAPEPVN